MRTLYTLYAENNYYNIDLYHTKNLDDAMKAGEMFGRVRENLVVWNDRYTEPHPERMERIVLCKYDSMGETTLGTFNESGDFQEEEGMDILSELEGAGNNG